MFRLAALALALAVPPAAHAAPSSATPPPALARPTLAPATIDFASQFDLTSKITGRTYRIFVNTPLTPPPKDGFPVLYVLDGNNAFPIAEGQAVLSVLGGAKPILVVGVGYPDAAAVMNLRNRDLTPSPPGRMIPAAGPMALNPWTMGARRPFIDSWSKSLGRR